MEIYGKNVIDVAVQNNIKIKKIYLDKNKYSYLINKLSLQKTEIHSFEEYKGQTPPVHQKIIAIVDEFKYLELNELIDYSFQKTKNPILVILDKITDPQNLGAIIRNQVAFDIEGIIIPKFHQTPINNTAIKASAGAALISKVALTSSLNNVVARLKDRGFWIVSTAMNGELSLQEAKKLDRPLVIILGSEGEGVSPSLLAKSDYKLSIKISNNIESLNVASTSAVIFQQLSKL